MDLRQFSSHGRNQSQTIFAIRILMLKILAASNYIIDFFCKNIPVSSFCDNRKFTSTLITIKANSKNHYIWNILIISQSVIFIQFMLSYQIIILSLPDDRP